VTEIRINAGKGKEGNPGRWNLRPARQPGHCHTPALKSSPTTEPARGPRASSIAAIPEVLRVL